MRREAQRTASRHMSLSLVLLISAAGMAVVSNLWPPEAAEIARQADAVASSMPTVHLVPTPTPMPATATPRPPTAIPYPTAAQTVAPSSTPVPKPNDKLLTLRAISSRVNANGQPISSTAEFTAGVAIVYIFFDYRSVPAGALMRQTWLHDGSSVHFDSAPWTLSGSGTASASWSPKNGFQKGLYEVRVSLGDVKQFTANFMVH